MEEPLLEGQSETQPRRCGPCVGPGAVACVAGVALLLIVTSSAVAIGLSERDQAMPDCRKSAPVAVFTRFSHPDNAMLSDVCNEDDAFLLFGGKGKKTAAFDDVWMMCMQSDSWINILKDGHHHAKAPNEPQVRWKVAHMTGTSGLYIMGGSELKDDSAVAAEFSPNTPSNKKKLEYYNDVWVYSIVQPLGWRLLHPGDNNAKSKKSVVAPKKRRAHVGIMYQHADGHDEMIIYGGRTKKGHTLNDIWAFNVKTSMWRLLGDWSDEQGAVAQVTGGSPPSRKGHVAVPAPSASGKKPYLVIHGGRPDVGYYGDVWAFDLNTLEWENWHSGSKAPDALVPAPRDHHVGHYFNNALYIHGGRGGYNRVWANATQFDDLWRFDIRTRLWTELKPQGPKPLPRWLHTATGYASKQVDRIVPAVGELNRFVVYGGEDMRRCYMNDVWAYDVVDNRW
eukprot:CAMPEP_0177769882 /NCGR_PEP_ID=MMETSP0491_2-20121128/10596_1 /TAXON_ID=63592 /ORGANISM="Tetraselmis chuii, Strain PLY429" /LENGTH=450 /DNA_ID=CAMNT_0019286995 /DNA_START=301 /DNA_END=1650 /DNA_ORIENTATION=+